MISLNNKIGRLNKKHHTNIQQTNLSTNFQSPNNKPTKVTYNLPKPGYISATFHIGTSSSPNYYNIKTPTKPT